MYKEKIRVRLQGKPHLWPIHTNTCRIPERLREMDPNLFVVLNRKTNRFEIHSLANYGDTFSLLCPFDELDSRIESHVAKYDLKRHGMRIYHEMARKEEEAKRAEERDRQNRVETLSREIHKPVRKLAYWGEQA